MPEYLAPGVYVEEVSFRAKSIEGLSTSVAGFIGPTRYGPWGGAPELLTSFADFSRIYGGIDQLQFESATDAASLYAADNYMAHAVRAFFDNGGSMLYVTRVYQPSQQPADPANPPDPDEDTRGKAWWSIGSPANLVLRARFPGQDGNMRITFGVNTTANLLTATPTKQVSSVREHDVVYIKDKVALSPVGSVTEGLYDVVNETTPTGNVLAFDSPTAGRIHIADLDPANQRVHRVTVTVSVQLPGRFDDEQVWANLAPHPSARSSLMALFTDVPNSRLAYLTVPFAIEAQGSLTSGAQLTQLLLGNHVLQAVSRNLDTDRELSSQSPPLSRPDVTELARTYVLTGGSDGKLPSPEYYDGQDSSAIKTGLKTFEDVDEISIVGAPGHSAKYGGDASADRAAQIVQFLLVHCQIRMRYRVAVLDSPDGDAVSEVQDYRGQFDSTHAALYYPWITIVDPLDPDGRREIQLPPSGFVAGIYARTDMQYGVFKAPANEVVLGAVNFETLLNTAQQDILNPNGINCFRFFRGRGFRLWGARTISSDPEWKYISVRRYFAYLEHSIDKGTQWAVFENNNDTLWANVRQTITDFLFNEWRNGALLGLKPEQAFFVRCDRSTMTQNDLDNGRLVCLIGVAVVKPAEFVIFRIGQFTADAQRT